MTSSTLREGALTVLKQRILENNAYQIDEDFAEQLANRMIHDIEIEHNESTEDTNNKVMVYVQENKTWKVEFFEKLADAVLFAQTVLCGADVVCDNHKVDWVHTGKQLIYKDINTGRLQVIQIMEYIG